MTVSFTKKEVEWLFECLYVATQDVDEELDDFYEELIDATKRIKEKLRIAQVKETLKRKKKGRLIIYPS